jgi:ferredoxin
VDLIHHCKRIKAIFDYRSGKLKPIKKVIAKAAIRILPNELHPVLFGALSSIAEGRLALYHGAPTVILIYYDSRGISKPLMDCGIAGQNMVLAAHSLGLGTCWVGFVGLILKMKKWRKFFGIGYRYRFASSIAIGYPLGDPNGFVERETHQVDWYSNGTKRVIDSEKTSGILAREAEIIPSYNRKEDIAFGHVAINSDCIGCGICVDICPADSLVLLDKKCRMVEKSECIFCGDCQAICARNAIQLIKPPVYTKYYKTIDRGPVKPPRLNY